ncbi:transposase family protein [Streptomyces sp. Wb2n-11]|uniref:transposase family protein n=1 Tax=Streptomyces sp. Wb2n-11 TaxID=1030533 RepID=UPI000A418F77|nr:transposase family protein [Streptomyces sp. Wb2n-11]
MVTYRATPNVPSDLASWLENLITARRDEAEGSWRILTPWDQTVPALVRMTKGDTFEQPGKHFGTSTDTAWRYVDEAVEALAALTPTLEQVLAASGERRRPLLDGTLIPAWRRTTVATGQNPDPLYSGKHRDHGVNVQALAAPEGELVLLGGARPGSTHDLTAARADGIVEAVTAADVETTADSGYQGAGGTVRTPIKHPRGKGHNGWERQADSALAKPRAAAEHPLAQLKRWRVLDRLRISPNKATGITHAVRSSRQRDGCGV